MRPMPDGVGVNGTGLIGLAVSAVPRRCLFAGSGVEGTSDIVSTLVVVGGLVRLVAPTVAAFMYTDSVASVAAPFVLPTLRAERRRDIVILRCGVCLRLVVKLKGRNGNRLRTNIDFGGSDSWSPC